MVVLYGFQGADTDAEQLALTEQLFDATLGELSVVARGQPCMLVGDFNVEPTRIPCLAKGILAGLIWRGLGLQLLVRGLPLLVRGVGVLLVVGCPLAVAAVLSCNKVQPDRWIAPHLAVRALFDCCRWAGRVTQPVQRTSLWPASWSRGSKSVAVQRVWEVYDERLQFMSRPLMQVMFLVHGLFGLGLLRLHLLMLIISVVDPFLPGVWSLGRGSALFRVVRLGGHRVRKARGKIADAHDAADVFLYRDSSIAPLLDLRRRFKAVMMFWMP